MDNKLVFWMSAMTRSNSVTEIQKFDRKRKKLFLFSALILLNNIVNTWGGVDLPDRLAW